MEITIIAEASTRFQRYRKHWGLSILIDQDLLFDTFANARTLKQNLKKAKTAPEQIRSVFISHEHWDHTGGLLWLLEQSRQCTVYLSEHFSTEFKNKIRKFPNPLKLIQKPLEIQKDIFALPALPWKANGTTMHEQSLVIRKKELTLITGCSHPGILKILQQTSDLFSEPLHLVIGGLHLKDSPKEDIKKISASLKKQTQKISACHCTGKKAVHILKSTFHKNFIPAHPLTHFHI